MGCKVTSPSLRGNDRHELGRLEEKECSYVIRIYEMTAAANRTIKRSTILGNGVDQLVR